MTFTDLNADRVAAGVEECTKHFALRFCRLNASGTAGLIWLSYVILVQNTLL